ncbi:MAG: DUF1254 domain-containing protein [Solirubrobacterales bacterium]|nr:DUF1254 domain-containing protein [Solirubrobacterales bacterium]MCB8970987.1 DUF1254 domain-containing protein [Thermoleophilales bacterium]
MRALGRVVVIAIAAAILLPLGAAGGATAKKHKPPRPSVPKCALGELPKPLRDSIPTGIAQAERRFIRAQGLSGADADHAGRIFAASEAAYLYGNPAVLTKLTVQRWGANILIGVGRLATPESRTVVSPNNDTLYSVANIDLSAGPMIIDAPATGGRYSVVQLMDAYTNSFAYIGSGSSRDSAQTVALVPPGWQGDIPGAQIVHSPTNLVWYLGRTLVDGESDLTAATDLMKQYALTPLAGWSNGVRRKEAVFNTSAPQQPVVAPQGPAFFDAMSQRLASDPPPAEDACAVQAFARAGISAGATPSANADPLVQAALTAAWQAGDRLVDKAYEKTQAESRRKHDGWSFSRRDAGDFGLDYAYRATVASAGLASNIRSEAFYPQAHVDSDGKPLKGSRDYVVKFAAGQLPPVRAFWSMTMYDSEHWLVDNPINRYAVGDRTDGLIYGKGGSLKIYISHDAPAGNKAANWLPSPEGSFQLNLRLYEPQPSAYSGAWEPPKVIRLK